MSKLTAFSLSFYFTASTLLSADMSHIAGVYFPKGDEGVVQWSCNADHVGLDGGALVISASRFEAVDLTCEMASLSPSGKAVRATLDCMSEGQPFKADVIFTPTPTGVEITDEHGSVYWMRCDT
jgi:hypothetical protein